MSTVVKRTNEGDVAVGWGRNDSFVVPSWAWHRQVDGNTNDTAVLYAVTAAPKHLGLYRAETR